MSFGTFTVFSLITMKIEIFAFSRVVLKNKNSFRIYWLIECFKWNSVPIPEARGTGRQAGLQSHKMHVWALIRMPRLTRVYYVKNALLDAVGLCSAFFPNKFNKKTCLCGTN